MVICKEKHHEQDWRMIREAVFVQEQGFVHEFDHIDEYADHIVLFDDKQPIGCGRVYPDQGIKDLWYLGRLAILPTYRGLGYGMQIVHTLERLAKQKGANRIVLSAQLHAIAFYERCGYGSFEEIFFDEHVPHQKMKKHI